MVRLAGLRERLNTSLWFLPTVFALGALVLGMVMLSIDRELQANGGSFFFVYGGTAEGARNVLSTVAQSMLTFTGLVFTVTMLVLQQAASQLSQRVLRTFLADRQNQVVLGLFVATFVYTLVVLRDVRASGAGFAFVPALSVWLAFVLLGASVLAFIYYINHMGHAIRASTVIANIADDTEAAIDRAYPEEPKGALESRESNERVEQLRASRRWRTIDAERGGSVLEYSEERIVHAAQKAEVLVEMVPTVGDFVPRGTVLFRIEDKHDGAPLPELDAELRAAVAFGRERTMTQDPAYGFRQLVDVASRALSPGTNDPTTAVQAIDRLHDLLLRLAGRPMPSPVVDDEDGQARLIVHHRAWARYVRLAVEEPRLYGERHIQVVQRLRVMLESLAEHCPDERLGVVRRELILLERQIAGLSSELAEFDVYQR